MLNGIAPLIIVSIKPDVITGALKSLAGVPVLQQALFEIGIPFPIYLDPDLTGMHVDTETRAMDIDTDIKQETTLDPITNTVKSNGFSIQSGINNLVTINLLATRTSIGLNILLAFTDIIFNKLTATRYNISYINGSNVVINGLLHSFSTNTNANDDLLHVTLQLQKPNLNKPTPQNLFYAWPKATGAQPVVAP